MKYVSRSDISWFSLDVAKLNGAIKINLTCRAYAHLSQLRDVGATL